MPKPKSFFRVFTETGPLIVLAVAVALLVGIAGPASAQFFNFGGPPRPQPRSRTCGGGGGWFGGDLFAPFQQQAPKAGHPENFSKAPPPEKRETVPERNVLVLGDAMADWLAYGLEDAYVEQPDMGVIRKHKTVSGLIKYQPKGDPADWAAAAKGILATEKPDAIVVMLGLNDRVAMREPAAEKSDSKPADKKSDKKDARAKPDAKPADAKPAAKPMATADAAKPDDKTVDTELPPDDAADNDAPPAIAPEKSTRSPNGIYRVSRGTLGRTLHQEDRRDDRRAEIQGRAGAVGRPARGARRQGERRTCCSWIRSIATPPARPASPMSMSGTDLSTKPAASCRRARTSKASPASLRSYDGVYFTKPGARKLAHYVEREITRLLAARSAPIALPTEPATPDANALPGQPAPRPLAGPILPLVASSVGTDQLLGGPGSRPAAVDALAARTLVKGEPLAPPAGRADDFVWPRREVGREQAKGETPVASVAPDGTVDGSGHAAEAEEASSDSTATPRCRFNPARRRCGTSSDLAATPRQPQPPLRPAMPRPPGNVGRSASAPGFFTR